MSVFSSEFILIPSEFALKLLGELQVLEQTQKMVLMQMRNAGVNPANPLYVNVEDRRKNVRESRDILEASLPYNDSPLRQTLEEKTNA